jgi:hypothetical protein
MLELEILKTVGYSAVGVLVALWLAVSFMAPGRTRSLTARAAAAALYVALACLFVHLVQTNWEKGRMVLVVPFGFLLAVFVAGLVLTIVKWTREVSGAGPSAESATH